MADAGNPFDEEPENPFDEDPSNNPFEENIVNPFVENSPPPVCVQVKESLCDPSNMGRLNCLSGEQLRHVDKQLSAGTSLRNVELLRSTGLNKLLKVNLCSNRPPTPTYTQPQPNVPHPPPTTTSAKQPPNNHQSNLPFSQLLGNVTTQLRVSDKLIQGKVAAQDKVDSRVKKHNNQPPPPPTTHRATEPPQQPQHSLPYSQLPGRVVTQPGVSKEIGEVAQGDTVDSRGREHIHPPPPTTCHAPEQNRQQQPVVKLPRNVSTQHS